MGWQRVTLPAVITPDGWYHRLASDVPMHAVGQDAKPILLLTHSGENPGVLTTFNLFPENQSAVIVMGNSTAKGDATDIMAQMLLQEILGVQDLPDYLALAKKYAQSAENWHNRMIERPLAVHKRPETKPEPLADYVGTYQDHAGTMLMKIVLEGKVLYQLLAGLASQKKSLQHYHYDMFSLATSSYDEHMQRGMIDYDDWRMMLLRFERDYDGEIVAVSWLSDPMIQPVKMLKQADK